MEREYYSTLVPGPVLYSLSFCTVLQFVMRVSPRPVHTYIHERSTTRGYACPMRVSQLWVGTVAGTVAGTKVRLVCDVNTARGWFWWEVWMSVGVWCVCVGGW